MNFRSELDAFQAQQLTRRSFLGRASQGLGALALSSLIHPAAASRKSTVPAEGGYPLAPTPRANSSSTKSGGGSIGVPIEQSMAPPSNADAAAFNPSKRS